MRGIVKGYDVETCERDTYRCLDSGVGSSISEYSSDSRWLIAAKTCDITY